jgi:hypothetical protein
MTFSSFLSGGNNNLGPEQMTNFVKSELQFVTLLLFRRNRYCLSVWIFSFFLKNDFISEHERMSFTSPGGQLH